MSTRYNNPLKQWCYDNRVSQRQFLLRANLPTSINKRLFSEDPALLKDTTVGTLARVQRLTKVSLCDWYTESVSGRASVELRETKAKPLAENVPPAKPTEAEVINDILANT